MDQHSIIDKRLPDAPVPPETAMRGWPGTNRPDADSSEMRFPGEDGGRSLSEMAERDLGATLQLLAERAQYITGGTGAAIALRDGDELVCKASAGESAPGVGTLLQVNSGLSGESVRTGQTLVCADAATDDRVNRESCQALGIAAVVVMPLLRDGAVMGVFELFSDQPHAFGERDLMALERLGSMVHTALDCAVTVSETPQNPVGETRSESAVVIPMGPPAAVSAAKVETPGNELFERDAMPQGPLSATGKTAGPQLAFPRIAFHGRTPPRTVKDTTPRLALDRAGEGPETISPPGVEEAAAPLEPTLGVEADGMGLSESELAETVARKYAEPNEQAESVPAEWEKATVQGDASALSAAVQTAQQRAAWAEVVLADPAAGGREAPVAIDAVCHLSEATAPATPVPAAPKPRVQVSMAAVPPPLTGDPKARSEVASLGRCQACGFPISPGRVWCLDCEKKARAEGKSVPSARAPEPRPAPTFEAGSSAIQDRENSVPMFLVGEEPEAPGSWLSSHKYLVGAIVIALVGIVALLLLR